MRPEPGAVERYGPGEDAASFDPGDFILTHADHLSSRLIRFSQRWRMRGARRDFAHWSHAAIVVDKDGGLVEAEVRGIQRSHISKYRNVEYHLVRLGRTATADDRAQAAAFALSRVGKPFGFGTASGIALSLLTGSRLSLWHSSHDICSGLVGRALERTWIIFERDPDDMLPADLAEAYGVRPSVRA
jgi:cell wall-associated NlpC family hydrolase